jgi:cell division protease FtsH
MSATQDSRDQLEMLRSAAKECGYSIEAVMLVAHAVSRIAADEEDRDDSDDGAARISAKAICSSLIQVAGSSYGDRALDTLEAWRLSRSEDVGRVVTGLVKAGVIRSEPGDAERHFEELFGEEDLIRAFSEVPDQCEDSTPMRRDSMGDSGLKSITLVPKLIEKHFHPLPIQGLTLTTRSWPHRVRVDLQRAIDRILERVQVVHFSGVLKQLDHRGIELHDLMTYNRHDNAITVPPMFEEIDIGEEMPARCLQLGLWLIRFGAESNVPAVILMAPKMQYGQVGGIRVEIGAPADDETRRETERFFRELEVAVQESRSYRGKVLSLEESDHYRGLSRGILVHRLRTVDRDQVILPRTTLNLLERNVINFVGQRPRLRQLGMQAKKGLLFYGPPGTGKTHTIHYLAGSLPGHTTLLITAEQVGLLSEYMVLARLLQPSIVIIEDADLIGRDRGHRQGPCDESLLNRLLNEMDGLREDAEVLFILTTNRPEMLEPALAARPGRIDQAIEFPLPDAEGREKLIRLYARSATLDDEVILAIVRKTEHVSGAFIKELMRRSAQFHMERSETSGLELCDVADALEEMLFAGGSLNKRLLGAHVDEPTETDR